MYVLLLGSKYCYMNEIIVIRAITPTTIVTTEVTSIYIACAVLGTVMPTLLY